MWGRNLLFHTGLASGSYSNLYYSTSRDNKKQIGKQLQDKSKLHTPTSSEVFLTVCTEDDGNLFLPSVANEGTFADSDSTWLLLTAVTGLLDDICLCCKNYITTLNIKMRPMNLKNNYITETN